MAVKKGYKQTEVGLIPEDWDVNVLRNLSERIIVGIASAATHAYRTKGVPMFRNQNITPSGLDCSDLLFISTEYENQFRNKRLKSGDLLTMRTGYPGVTAIVPNEYEGAQSFTTLITRPNTNCVATSYLCCYINSATGHKFFEQSQIGGAQKNVNVATLKTMPIPLPPTLHEQEAIAGALSDADAWIESLEQLIAKKHQIKQGAMQELLTGKRRLPGFSGEWEWKRLGEVATFLSGGTPSRENDHYWKGTIPWISASSLRCFEVCRSDSNVTKEAVAAGSKMAPLGSTLLLVRGSALHNEILCGLVTRLVCFNQDVKALIPAASVVPRFLTTALRAREQDLLGMVTSAGNTAGVLDTKQLKAFEIPVPTSHEQMAITTVLSDMDTEIESLESKLAKAREIKQGMMQELLTGRIRLI